MLSLKQQIGSSAKTIEMQVDLFYLPAIFVDPSMQVPKQQSLPRVGRIFTDALLEILTEPSWWRSLLVSQHAWAR